MANSKIMTAVGDVLIMDHSGLSAATTGLYLNGIKVVGEQAATQAAVTPAADGTLVGTAFNTLLAKLKTHGLLA